MKKRNRILACLLALALCAMVLPAAAAAATGSVVRKPKVTFVAGGEVFATVLVPYGDRLGNMPQVPEKEGYVGVWDKTVDIVTGDVTVSAFYTPIAGSAPADAPRDLMWLAIPVVLMSAAATVIVYKRKEQQY